MKKFTLVITTIIAAALLMSCSNVAKETIKENAAASETEAEMITPKPLSEIETQESIIKKDENGEFIKPEKLGAVITLGKYKGLTTTLDKVEVTDEEVEKELKNVHAADPAVAEADRQKDPDDAWVEAYTGGEYKSIDEFKGFIRDKMETLEQSTVEASAQNDLITQVLENSEINVTTEAIEYYYQTTMEEYRKAAEAAGMDVDDYINQSGFDPDALKLQLSYYAEESVKQKLMTDAIMKAENLTLEDADYQIIADLYGYDIETMKKLYGEENFEDYAKSYKIVRFIYENANLK